MADLLYPKNEKAVLRTIIAVSVAVPVLVGILIFSPLKLALPTGLVMYLPMLNAVINSLTAVLLVVALIAIKKNQLSRHRQLMLAAMALGALFLVSYVVYHASVPSAVYGDINGDGVRDEAEKAGAGIGLYTYLILLLTHIVFAAIVLPFVLMAAFFGLQDKAALHRKVVKWAYPMWLFVSVSGVLVYFMIKPFYNF